MQGAIVNLAVVFVSYLKVPEERLQDHFAWNKEAYEQFGNRLRVYVVTDIAHNLPPYATCVLFPLERLPLVDGRRRFSLTMTKNEGIRRAIDDGVDVIVCTDVDIAFQPQTLALMSTVPSDFASIPLYRMAPSFEDRDGGHIDHGCTGTVAMTAANWRRIQYDERCVGYGADDGILLRDIRLAELHVMRDHEVTHVAHVEGDGTRTPGSGSGTCWGREDGFNFDNFRKNRRLHRTRQRR
jgi:hypothetical protein